MSFDRVSALRKGIEPGITAAIEIGPLDKPILGKPDFRVRYLISRPPSSCPRSTQMIPTSAPWSTSTSSGMGVRHLIRFSVATEVDAVVASHVFEHIPDPIGWLRNFASVLRPGGTVTLAIPDMRYTFDVNRRVSEVSDLLDAYLRGAAVPELRADVRVPRQSGPGRCRAAVGRAGRLHREDERGRPGSRSVRGLCGTP